MNVSTSIKIIGHDKRRIVVTIYEDEEDRCAISLTEDIGGSDMDVATPVEVTKGDLLQLKNFLDRNLE